MNYYPFHIGDYASATRHLTWDEDAAYRRLLDAYYVREAPLPLELRQVYRLVGASTEAQREAVDTILEEFFTKTEDGYRHARCDAEIARMQDRRNKASQSASKRWSNANAMPPDSEGNANACDTDANACESVCEGNAPNTNTNTNKKHMTHSGRNDYPPEFEAAWKAYPRRAGDNPKGKAFKAWRARLAAGRTAEEIHAGVLRYAAYVAAKGQVGTEYVKQAATFFGPDEAFAEPWELAAQGGAADGWEGHYK